MREEQQKTALDFIQLFLAEIAYKRSFLFKYTDCFFFLLALQYVAQV